MKEQHKMNPGLEPWLRSSRSPNSRDTVSVGVEGGNAVRGSQGLNGGERFSVSF